MALERTAAAGICSLSSHPSPSLPRILPSIQPTPYVESLTIRHQQYPHLPQRIVSGRAFRQGSVRALSSPIGDSSAVTAIVTEFKHVLLPILDRNPYLSEATRQAAAVTASLAKRYGADITVVVIDEAAKERIDDYDLRMTNIRWHLAEGGYDEFRLMEKLEEGKKPAAVIGEVADDMELDLVVLSMESIHSKLVDGNLLAEFLPCPVLLLPL